MSHDRQRFHDELIRRMGEPEPYRSLRLQKERIEADREQQQREAMYRLMAASLRAKIRKLGEEPCA